MLGSPIGYGRTAELLPWEEGQVLKLFFAGYPLSAAQREAANTHAVHAASVASPAVGGVVTIDGRPGVVFERITGPSMMQAISARPWRIVRLAYLLAELQAQMHACVAPGLPLLQRRLVEKIENAPSLPPRLKQAALQALSRLPTGRAICHGDFHPDNVLLSHRGPVIIDWQDATCGNPLADIARTSLLLQTGTPPPGRAGRLLLAARSLFHTAYLRRYCRLRPVSAAELAAWRLPVAAARLSENVAEEEAQLLAIVERCAAS